MRSKIQVALACVTSALSFGVALAEPTPRPQEATAHATWSVGFARAAITPEKPMWMAGYAARDHRAEGRVHELFVRVCAIGEPAAVLITLDLIGIPRPLRAALAQRGEVMREEWPLLRKPYTPRELSARFVALGEEQLRMDGRIAAHPEIAGRADERRALGGSAAPGGLR